MSAERAGVWVTRPAGQARELEAALAETGVPVYLGPVLDIEELNAASPAGRSALEILGRIKESSHLLFVSANAARIGVQWLRRAGQIPLPQQLRLLAVGPATAAELQSLGTTPVTPEQEFTSEGLLALPELQQLAGATIVIVRGVGGRSLLADELARRGAAVSIAELYRRVAPGELAPTLVAGLQGGAIGAIMAASGETLDNVVLLTEAAGIDVRGLVVVVPGARVAAQAYGKGFRHVVVADSAVAGDMVRAWWDHMQRQEQAG